MEFRRFSRAVNNHGDQEYTMCDFLNLVKVTARDIQDEYGADVAELEWGDEKQLADLIANQCFVIGEMLDAVSSGGGSTGRIESLRKEIGTLRERSLSLKKSAEDIAALETKKQELSGQLEALNKQKAVYDELQQSIGNTQKAIDEANGKEIKATGLITWLEELQEQPHEIVLLEHAQPPSRPAEIRFSVLK